MIQTHVCPHCKTMGEIYLPYDKPKNTIVKCPICKEKQDISYLYIKWKSRGEMEWEEYQRLKKIYG